MGRAGVSRPFVFVVVLGGSLLSHPNRKGGG